MAAPEYSRSEGCQHHVVGEAQPGGGGEWPGWEEEEVARRSVTLDRLPMLEESESYSKIKVKVVVVVLDTG